MEDDVQLRQLKPEFFAQKVLNTFFAVCLLGVSAYYLFSSPSNVSTVRIHVGLHSTPSSISNELEARGVIRHHDVLKALLYLSRGTTIARGDYVFLPHTNVVSIAWDIARGHHNVDPIRVTLPEGATNDQIATILGDKLEGFRKDIFQEKVIGLQGQLFPDTYFFYSLSDTDEIIHDLQSDFTKRIHPLQNDIASSGRNPNEILTMASLIQKEAYGERDAPTIAGILWKRIALGMPLQVDAYRSTYTVKGLPGAPIGNPGLVAIRSSIHPVESPYLYYLHDKSGMVHYAATYKEHLHNIALYLK